MGSRVKEDFFLEMRAQENVHESQGNLEETLNL